MTEKEMIIKSLILTIIVNGIIIVFSSTIIYLIYLFATHYLF